MLVARVKRPVVASCLTGPMMPSCEARQMWSLEALQVGRLKSGEFATSGTAVGEPNQKGVLLSPEQIEYTLPGVRWIRRAGAWALFDRVVRGRHQLVDLFGPQVQPRKRT